MAIEGRALVAEHQERVEHELAAASGGASLCSISKSAGAVPGLKYLEGRMAVLMELARAMRRGARFDDACADAADGLVQRLEAARGRGMGPDWIAYYAGGVDELADLAAEVRGSSETHRELG